MDPISRLLDLSRVRAKLDYRCLLAGATVMEVPAYGEAEAAFHFLLEGECTLEVGDRSFALTAGDAVLLPGSPPHRIRTGGSGPARGVVKAPGPSFGTIRTTIAEEGVIDLFCGHYAFGSCAGVLLFRSLPDPVVVSFGEDCETVRAMITLMREEALVDGRGSAAILTSICTALLAMVLRQSSGRLDQAAHWTAVDDRRIAVVIDAVLRDPGHDWTIEKLAELTTMSRATFLRHFSKNAGTTVGVFLTNVRMMIAADLLGERDLTIATVARRVGYQSESAFARAFQQAIGATPGRYRREL